MATGLRKVGHKGADLIAPGNTIASFEAALAAGVDMIEFDILSQPEEEWRAAHLRKAGSSGAPRVAPDALVLAHDWIDAIERTPLTIEEGLDHLATAPFAGIELDVDLKLPGYELHLLSALRERGLLERTLISSQYRESLALIRGAEPGVRLGWSVPKLTRDPFRSPLMLPGAYVGLQALRALLPRQAAAAIRSGACDALMAQWRLVTPRLVRAVSDAGGELYVWTVDELPRIRALVELGVSGVITNDPRLFAALA
jgi:glycerophosphoryl diester phosphodiesterase